VRDILGLGGTTASAYALNGSGSVVGYSTLAGGQDQHAFLYRDDRIWDLNDLIPAGSGWELVAATDINDLGQIVGYGCKDSTLVPSGTCVDGNGTPSFRRAFLLTPVTSIANLEGQVRSFGLPRGLENSLLAKLAAAQRALEAGQTGAACNILSAFANQVEAQSGKGLTTTQAALLLQNLTLIRADLGCA
jgi:probable HAF family extracellular repeat protein